MPSWVLLGMAILAEVTATVALKLSDGFTRLAPICVVAVGYGASFFLLSRILHRGVSLGFVYTVWSGMGISIIVLVDALWFGHQLTVLQVTGLVLVVAGVAALQLGGGAA